MNTLPEHSCDVLIIGSGAAGLSLALRLADQHQVIVLSKGPVTEGSTFYAQGGIAAVFDETDSIDSHVEDTLIAGAGICDRHAVEFVASNARSCVQWLIDQGVLFDTHVQPNGEESYHLTREGGHSHRRILHAADATGREVQSTLVSKAQNHPNIRVLERSNAVDLIVSDKIGLRARDGLLARGYGTEIKKRWKPATQKQWYWQPAVRRRFISTPPIRIFLLAMALLWRGAQAVGLPISNLISSTLPHCITHRHAISC